MFDVASDARAAVGSAFTTTSTWSADDVVAVQLVELLVTATVYVPVVVDE